MSSHNVMDNDEWVRTMLWIMMNEFSQWIWWMSSHNVMDNDEWVLTMLWIMMNEFSQCYG
jgi:hypothetical protein